ncbi:TetR/AcrR family transcriptional regulator [Pseudonocardia sp. Cha107L01]|uniref:TetR/AcrR family transcriptional regulator n=1 Tax=Pseudonocardia sp. Cha107L01 TaxID=3457576 RepID=UPI00403E6B56
MVRYGTEHKQATRRRIIDAAGRRFKQDGIDGSGIATVMKDADLTNGAFYAHFISKDDLVATVLTEQLREQAAGFEAQAPNHAGLERIVREYFSAEHRDNPGDGCPSAALLDEIGRCPDAAKQAYTDGVLALAGDIATRLAPTDPDSVRVRTLGLFASMIGTLQLSRAVTDRRLSDDILNQGIQNTLILLGLESRT